MAFQGFSSLLDKPYMNIENKLTQLGELGRCHKLAHADLSSAVEETILKIPVMIGRWVGASLDCR